MPEEDTPSYGHYSVYRSNLGSSPDGIPVPVKCLRHGRQIARAQRFASRGYLQIGQSTAPCPKCGTPSPIEDGTYKFSEYAERKIAATDLRRQQKRRFWRLITRPGKDLRALAASAQTIDPALGEVTNAAIKQPEPELSLAVLAQIVRKHWFETLVIGALSAGQYLSEFAQGAEAAFNVRDRIVYGSDHPRALLPSEPSSSEPIAPKRNDQAENETRDPTGDRAEQYEEHEKPQEDPDPWKNIQDV